MNEQDLEMRGRTLEDVDGSTIGEIVDFYVDSGSNEPEWLVVETGLISKQNVVVPMEGLTRDEDKLRTPYPKDLVESAPTVDATSIDKETEESLYVYYNVRRELPGRTQAIAAFEQDRSVTGDHRLRSWRSTAA